MLLVARIIRIVHAINYEYWLRFLQVIEDLVADIFETRCRYYCLLC